MYISLLLKNSPNIDKFVYVIQNPESTDPYDLMMKDLKVIKNQNQKNKKKIDHK